MAMCWRWSNRSCAPSALIVADNAGHCPEYLARLRAHDRGYVSVPFAEDVEVSLLLGKDGHPNESCK